VSKKLGLEIAHPVCVLKNSTRQMRFDDEYALTMPKPWVYRVKMRLHAFL
jgi:hypothetical protein